VKRVQAGNESAVEGRGMHRELHHSEYRIPIVTFPRTIAPSLRTVEVYRSSKFVGFRNLFLTPCRAQCGVNSELRRAALRRNWRPHRRLHAGDSRECEGHGGGHQPGTEAQAETGGDGRSFFKFRAYFRPRACPVK